MFAACHLFIRRAVRPTEGDLTGNLMTLNEQPFHVTTPQSLRLMHARAV